MTQEERIKTASEEAYPYQEDQDIEDLASWNDVTDIQREAYERGYKACIDQEEWKNLYAEGLQVGMDMLKQALEHPNYKEIKEKAEKYDQLCK